MGQSAPVMKTKTDPKPQIQKVIFRASRRKAPEITAVLVGQPGSWQSPLTVWDSQCGHGNGSWDWYYSTRPATQAEYQNELTKLRRQYAPEYEIQVVRRYTRQDRDALNAKFYPQQKPSPILDAAMEDMKKSHIAVNSSCQS